MVLKRSSFLVSYAVLASALLAGTSESSNVEAASCSVTAEIAGVVAGSVDLRIRAVELKGAAADGDCPVREGLVYRAIDNDPGTLAPGQKIRADVSAGSAMGPGGVVTFLNWDHLAYADGGPIRSLGSGAVIMLLQSADKPSAPSKKTDSGGAMKPGRGGVGAYPRPEDKHPFAAISALNEKGEGGTFNTEGYVAYIAPDPKCGQDCAGGPTSYIVISESSRAFRRPSFQCSKRELVINFATDVPVWDLFKLGGKYRFTLEITRLGPRDAVVYHYDVLPRPRIIGDLVGVARIGGK